MKPNIGHPEMRTPQYTKHIWVVPNTLFDHTTHWPNTFCPKGVRIIEVPSHLPFLALLFSSFFISLSSRKARMELTANRGNNSSNTADNRKVEFKDGRNSRSFMVNT